MGWENHVVVDVSSDDEVDTSAVDRDYFDWLNDVMEAVDGKSDSADAVEVVSEVKGGVDSQYRKSNSSIQTVEVEDDDDDDDDDDEDCVILDCDPDKTTKTDAVDDGDDDDVVVVGEKGEIACRDFPHPRHSCAKFAYNSTSHETYCEMCHCYVCDIPAPCPYWCIGVSSIDHCHANDKEKVWKNQREYFRTGNMPTEPTTEPVTTPIPASSTAARQLSRSPTPNIIRLSQNSFSRSQVGVRPCSSSTRVANPSNVKARFRTNQSIPRNHNHGLQNRHVQPLLSNVRNIVIRKNGSSYMVNRRAQVASSETRSGATNGNSNKVGLYANGQVSQSTHHSSFTVAPTINPEMYTQQPNVTSDYCSVVPGSESNVYPRHSGQNIGGSGNRKLQTNADVFTPLETPVNSAQAVQQQRGTHENVLPTELSQFESWLMDSSNHTGSVTPLPEPVGQDYVNSLTFDFETFLNE